MSTHAENHIEYPTVASALGLDRNSNASSLISRAARVYKDLLHSLPYNSISHLYQYLAGVEPDRRFGTSCGFQAIAVGEALSAIGAQGVHYLMAGRHGLAVCDLDGETFLFDPYLLHVEPISLSRHGRGRLRSYPAYPIVMMPDGAVRHSELRVGMSHDGQRISLAYHKVSQSTGQTKLSRYFRVDLQARVSGKPSKESISKLLFHPEQNNLSIKVLSRTHGTLSDLIYPICYHHGVSEVSEEHLIVRTFAGRLVEYSERYRFQRAVAEMASELETTPDRVISFVLGGVQLYEQYAPAKIDYVPYRDYTPVPTRATPLFLKAMSS